MAILKIPDGNAFKLRITGLVNSTVANLSVLNNTIVNFVRRGRISQTFGFDTSGRIVIENDGYLARGIYGVEITGYYEGKPWRHYIKNAFKIVDESEDADDPTSVDDAAVYDLSSDMSFGGDGVTAEYVNEAIEAHDEDENAHQHILDLIEDAGKVDDVQVNGTSILDGEKIANIQINPTVDDNVGTPSVDIEVQDGVINLGFKNLKGEKGDTGATGATGPKGDSAIVDPNSTNVTIMEHTTGQSEIHVMSQKGITDELNQRPKGASDSDALLSICDPSGYVIARFNGRIEVDEEGNIKTLNFNSGNIATTEGLQELRDDLDNLEDDTADSISEINTALGKKLESASEGNHVFTICDPDGNVIATLDGYIHVDANGNITTANFDSSNVDTSETVEIVLPDNIYAVQGDTLQVFFSAILKVKNYENYDIRISCAKGKQYKRYFEYTPDYRTTADIGTVNFKVAVYDNNGNKLSEKSCNLITVAAPTSPSSQINIACFGSSQTQHGEWPGEACRRLIGTDGDSSVGSCMPVGKGLGNIAFVGRQAMGNGLGGYFGRGGWKWYNYMIQGAPAYRFYVSDVSSVVFNAVYTNNGIRFTVIEVNVTNGTGSILCSVSSSETNTPEASGTLTRVSEKGDAEITYSSVESDMNNPLWNDTNNKPSFRYYADTYCGGVDLDVVCFLLTWNGMTPYKTDFSTIKTQIRYFADLLHEEYPNAKMMLMSVPMPCPIDGSQYGATGDTETNSFSDVYALKITALNMAKAYQEVANEDGYSDIIQYVCVPCQFDCENSMPTEEKKVNVRNATTETVCGNVLHPAESGYYQIADAVYRHIVANFCQ